MKTRIIATLLIGLIFSGCQNQKLKSGKKVTLKGKGVEFVKFYATWCPPCKKLKPIVEGIKGDYPKVTFYEVDIDTNKELVQKYNVTSIPAIFIQVDGRTVKSLTGARDAATLKALLDQYRKK